MQTPRPNRRAASSRAPLGVRARGVRSFRATWRLAGDLEQFEAHLADNSAAAFTPLLDRGCEPQIMAAVRGGCSDCTLMALLESGASANAADEYGLTALHWASIGCRLPQAPWAERLQQLSTPFAFWIHFAGDAPPAPWDEAGMPTRDEMGSLRLAQFAPPPPWVEPAMPACDASASAPMSEDCRLALAVCLLSFGADAHADDSNGLTAADHAERNGFARLAILIRHWVDMQAARWLASLWHSTHDRLGDERPSLSTMPMDVANMVCDFLVPRELTC